MCIVQEESVVEQASLLSQLVNHVAGEQVLPENMHNPVVQTQRTHQDNNPLAGVVRDAWLDLAHAPVNIPDAMHIPANNAAMDKAWTKLWGKGTWKVDSAREKEDVIREANTQGRPGHVGKVMPRCFIKNRQLFDAPRTYKGRVVLMWGLR